MVSKSINNYFFYLFVYSLIFGVLLYDFMQIQGLFELSVLFLIIIYFIYLANAKKRKFNIGFLLTLLIFIFYLGYSFYVSYNTFTAIISDFFIQIRPYAAFFISTQISSSFSDQQKLTIKRFCIILWILFIPIGLYGLLDQSFFFTSMGNPTNFVTSIVCLSVVHLYCSDFSPKEKLLFFSMLSIALIVAYFHFNYFFITICCIFLFFYQKDILKYKHRIGIALTFIFVILLYFSSSEIKRYLAYSGEDYDFLTRSNLYKTSFNIIKDFFPLGTGFASFATQASGAQYSQIYLEYGLNSINGLTPQNWLSVSNSYYPSLAQYGFIGLIFYFLFWAYIIAKSVIILKKDGEVNAFVIVLILASFIFIENISYPFLTSNKGFFIMLFLGLLVRAKKEIEYEIHIEGLSEPSNKDTCKELNLIQSSDYQNIESSISKNAMPVFNIDKNRIQNTPTQKEPTVLATSESTFIHNIYHSEQDNIYFEPMLEEMEELDKNIINTTEYDAVYSDPIVDKKK